MRGSKNGVPGGHFWPSFWRHIVLSSSNKSIGSSVIAREAYSKCATHIYIGPGFDLPLKVKYSGLLAQLVNASPGRVLTSSIYRY